MGRAARAGDPPLESKVTKAIMAYLKGRGVWCFKVAGGPMQQRGVPDIICCWGGSFVALEVKRPELGRLTDLQALTIERIRAAGGVAEVVTSVEEAVAVIDRVVPRVVHAFWKNPGYLDMHCSNCGGCPSREEGESPEETDFCAYCGAIMDGEDGLE